MIALSKMPRGRWAPMVAPAFKPTARFHQFLFVCVFIFAACEFCFVSSSDLHPSTSPSDLYPAATVKAKNSDLLSFKMFGELENDPNQPAAFESGFSGSNSLARFQRHANNKKRRHRKRKQPRKGGYGALPVNSSSPSVVSFKNLVPDKEHNLGHPPPQLTSSNGRGFCKTVPFTQWINVTGCIPKAISNSYCFGTCNSFYIPTDDKDNNFIAFTSCQFCSPKKKSEVRVPIYCPLVSNGDTGRDEQSMKLNPDDNQISPAIDFDQDMNPALANMRMIYKTVHLVKKCRCHSLNC